MLETDWFRKEAIQAQLWLWMLRNERYWRQLSRCKIIKEGDRNTKFFHLKASFRRQRKSIDKLLVDGVELSDPEEIKIAIRSYFKELYKKKGPSCFDISDLDLPRLSPNEAMMLELPVTEQEIKEALLDCSPSKAPGYDGFNMKCIREVWPIVGEDFSSYIQQFFQSCKLHPSFNMTWVALIPKKSGVIAISEYRPISMVGSLYKVIAKILSARLKKVLPRLIGST